MRINKSIDIYFFARIKIEKKIFTKCRARYYHTYIVILCWTRRRSDRKVYPLCSSTINVHKILYFQRVKLVFLRFIRFTRLNFKRTERRNSREIFSRKTSFRASELENLDNQKKNYMFNGGCKHRDMFNNIFFSTL